MHVLVTGGAGYVGSVCSAVLLESGHDVSIIDDFSAGNRDAVPAEAHLIEGELSKIIDQVLAENSFDAVVHCAARSLVGESVSNPELYWHANVVTTLRLLDAMRTHQVSNLVFSSTAATYGEPESVPIEESAPTTPTNPYGASKLAIDHIISSYAKAYGLAATSLRYFNVAGAYGKIGENRRTETHLIPLILQVALGHRDKIMVFGDDYPTADGTAVRDYIHVYDLAQAHVLALESNIESSHRVYNLGSGDGYSVQQVISQVRATTGHPIPAELAPRRAGDPATLIASSAKITTELGWNPTRTNLPTIVADAWEFTRQLGVNAHSHPRART
ncbi:UDP-glucose 4-epimerase GalE [Corynebacterium pseudodiphtheriticum]|uniref:UDP-glucose 4-epimerase GalE n=1 Tax=Corynebacterium pseudodiphtheriticum TaxID=37637 RepID=UPI00254A67EF|nr:UDP-glucose 4-epimerase GalE [Corynebacterium pseudodiphtheriticum]MDK8477489.1 UDP-glucose 4-epimerase GalE [Corynebacterium pseudodiphtheriticum]MDK8485795.1 UDP-glucose 4-epimerase GalE [Corynebacterium pseudodiphtheriticum]MDK8493028.1 UDP-glucose 4-epimerase GalE [Corynebacterium pseudodiphtheriticum]MDK8613718.1 UDP-glucose 4-epimerase GalE [Corynebacterium pseudodiphtheriticum]MDK8737653.1 UDP-glucose 4-epimerase GalE [Corynebacterium pseudodiphtheriticum]